MESFVVVILLLYCNTDNSEDGREAGTKGHSQISSFDNWVNTWGAMKEEQGQEGRGRITRG